MEILHSLGSIRMTQQCCHSEHNEESPSKHRTPLGTYIAYIVLTIMTINPIVIKIGQYFNSPVIVIYLVTGFMITALLWAHFSIIEQRTRASGRVIPSTQVKRIQNLEGGILKKLFVKEGQSVKKNQILAELDDAQFQSEQKHQFTHMLNLMATIDRLKAEANEAKQPSFNKILDNHPHLQREQKKLFTLRKKALEDKLELLNNSYQFTVKELKITRPLVKKGVMSRLELLQLERRANDLKTKLYDEKRRFQQDALKQLDDKQAALRVTTEKLTFLTDRVKRTTIRSPVNGIIKQIHINTLGGVIKPGMDIMEIVPIDDRLLIEVNVSPKDIAFLYPGLKAMVQVTAYDFTLYGGLQGKVVYVSADSQLDKNGSAFYEVWIRTDKNYLAKQKKLKIIPGMVVAAQIITAKRSILSYILKPILRARFLSLGER